MKKDLIFQINGTFHQSRYLSHEDAISLDNVFDIIANAMGYNQEISPMDYQICKEILAYELNMIHARTIYPGRAFYVNEDLYHANAQIEVLVSGDRNLVDLIEHAVRNPIYKFDNGDGIEHIDVEMNEYSLEYC